MHEGMFFLLSSYLSTAGGHKPKTFVVLLHNPICNDHSLMQQIEGCIRMALSIRYPFILCVQLAADIC